MHDYLLVYLRWLGVSAFTLAVALCMRLGPAHAAIRAPEPRISAPPQGEMALAPVLMTEDEQIADLDAHLVVLSAEIAHLEKALDVLGPLPDHPRLFVPVDPAELRARSTGLLADVHSAGLGALAGLRPQPADLGQAQPEYELAPCNIVLGEDMDDEQRMAALCVELSALTGAPRVVAPIRAW